ncbi:MAG: transposase [candidate division WOR-3 bacterium]
MYCLGGQELVYWGEEKRRQRVKYRCPIVVEGGNCLFAPLCNRSRYGRSFYIGRGTEFRVLGIALTGKRRWQKEYSRKRSKLEAENGILKNNRGMKNFYFRRRRKVRFYAMLCCLGELGKRLAEIRAKCARYRRVA